MAAGGPDRPVLARGTRIVRQAEGGEVRWVVRAGSSGKYLRVGEREQLLLSLMDGERTVAEIATGFTARAREPVQASEVATFVSQMRKLQVVEETAEARNLLLLEKARQRRKERHFAGKMGSLFFFRVKLLDPDRLLVAVERRVRWIFTRWFLCVAGALVVAAVAVLWSRSAEVFDRLSSFSWTGDGAGTTFAGIWTVALCIVALHELGHGVACKHWGGDVHEMGFLLLFFQPCFYCNVNDAWTFDSRAQRLWVTAAGGFVEVVLGSFCVLLWAATELGTAIHTVSYLVFMISLSSTLVFNMNPLIKLDGYYLLADLLGIENLREKSLAQLHWLIRGRILGQPAARATEDPREAWILATYGILSSCYLGLLLVVIAVVVLGAVTGEGGASLPLVVIMGFLGWMILKPVVKMLGGAMKDVAVRQAERHGPRGALLRFGAGTALVIGASFLVPWTRTVGGAAPAEPRRIAEVRSSLTGRVAEVLVAEGAAVRAGDPLLRIEAPVEAARAAMDRERASLLRREALRLRGTGEAGKAAAAEEEAEASRLRAEEAERRLGRSDLPSPLDGVVLTRRAGELAGSPVFRNSAVVTVGDCSGLRFRTILGTRDRGAVREGMEAVVRFPFLPGEPLKGRVVAVSATPVTEAENPGAGKVGGPAWEVVVEVENPGNRVLPGMTGEVAVVLGRTSLGGALARSVSGAFRADLLR